MIDEIFRILRQISLTSTPPRPHEILQELRDISSMAMEHFDEKILPDLKMKHCAYTSVSNVSSYELPSTSLKIAHHSGSSRSVLSHGFSSDRLRQIFKTIYSRTRKNKTSVVSVKGQIGKLKQRMKRQGLQMQLQSAKLQEQAKKINEQDNQIAEMRKHLEEWEQKIGDLTAELSRAREEDSIDGCKRKHIDVIGRESDSANSKELQAKKRKLIIERKSSNDAKDVKFKMFMSSLLAEESSQ